MKRNTNTAFFIFMTLAFLSCQNEKSTDFKEQLKYHFNNINQESKYNTIISKRHNPNSIFCELDGDDLSDTVQIVQHIKNKKYGLKIIFGNTNLEYLELGDEILGQGFDDLSWVGVFEKAPKGDVYWNNVNVDGEIIMEGEVKEINKIKLPNDGIFIHQAESCGGGVIYMENGKFKWIQQD